MSAKPAPSIPVDLYRPAWDVSRGASARIRRGDVITTPPDTLYAPAADRFQPAAVVALTGRPRIIRPGVIPSARLGRYLP